LRTGTPLRAPGLAVRGFLYMIHRHWRRPGAHDLAQITPDAAEDFRLPRDRTVITGLRMEI
jgi:hypothetical protein